MRFRFSALLLVLGLTALAQAEMFSSIGVYKTTTTKNLVVTDSAIIPKIRVTTINGYAQATYSVLDSALTGYATNPTDTLRLVCGTNVNGYFVAGITGTSNGAALTVGHLPSGCRPSHTVVVPLSKVTDNSITRIGFASIASTGIMTISKTDTAGVQSATFTASGTKGIGAGVTFSFPRF